MSVSAIVISRRSSAEIKYLQASLTRHIFASRSSSFSPNYTSVRSNVFTCSNEITSVPLSSPSPFVTGSWFDNRQRRSEHHQTQESGKPLRCESSVVSRVVMFLSSSVFSRTALIGTNARQTVGDGDRANNSAEDRKNRLGSTLLREMTRFFMLCKTTRFFTIFRLRVCSFLIISGFQLIESQFCLVYQFFPAICRVSLMAIPL